MSPYRQPKLQPPTTAARPRSVDRRGLGLVVMLGSTQMTALYLSVGQVGVGLAFLVGVAAGVWLIAHGKSDPSAHARLARLMWHRGDRVAALLLRGGVIAPRCSPKRMARIRAIAAAKARDAAAEHKVMAYLDARHEELNARCVEAVIQCVRSVTRTR